MNYVYKLNNGTKRILGETGFWGLLRLEAWGKRKCVCVLFVLGFRDVVFRETKTLKFFGGSLDCINKLDRV